MAPLEEWLTYLILHCTRLFLPSPLLMQDPKALGQTIYERTLTSLKRKQAEQLNPHQLQRNSIKNITKPRLNKYHIERGF